MSRRAPVTRRDWALSRAFRHIVVKPGEAVILRLPDGADAKLARETLRDMAPSVSGRVVIVTHDVEVFVGTAP